MCDLRTFIVLILSELDIRFCPVKFHAEWEVDGWWVGGVYR